MERTNLMAVSKQDREDYERGRSDSKLGWFDKAVNDITVQHPDNEAYYKGRRDEQLDEDKKDK
jgi:hypothetical protein